MRAWQRPVQRDMSWADWPSELGVCYQLQYPESQRFQECRRLEGCYVSCDQSFSWNCSQIELLAETSNVRESRNCHQGLPVDSVPSAKNMTQLAELSELSARVRRSFLGSLWQLLYFSFDCRTTRTVGITAMCGDNASGQSYSVMADQDFGWQWLHSVSDVLC